MKKYKITIGVDLATRNIGVCYLIKDLSNFSKKEFDFSITELIKFDKFSEENLDFYIFEFAKILNLETIKNDIPELKDLSLNDFDLNLGIELSNFANNQSSFINVRTTNIFHFLAGIFYGVDFAMKNKYNKKVYNANEWYQYIGNVNVEKVERKLTAKKFMENYFNENFDNLSQDEIDAFCIAYFFEKCLSTEIRSIITGKRKKQKKEFQVKKVSKIRELEKEIYKTLTELNKLKNNLLVKKVRESTKSKIEFLENKYKELLETKKQMLKNKFLGGLEGSNLERVVKI